MARTTTFRDPQDYVDTVDDFIDQEVTAVKLTDYGREDAALLMMVVHLKKLPVEVRIMSKVIYLIRTDR